MSDIDLRECLTKVRQGDGDAFTYIYNELKQPVFTIISRIVQSRETAEDVTQDLFVKLYVSPPDASVKKPRAWIFQMARNLAIDAWRKERRTVTDDVEPLAVDSLTGITTRLDIESAIGALPCEEREILSLHLTAELRFNQIAIIVGLSVPATYRKYRKAVNSLRELLSGGAI